MSLQVPCYMCLPGCTWAFRGFSEQDLLAKVHQLIIWATDEITCSRSMDYWVPFWGPVSVMKVPWASSKFKATSYYSVHPLFFVGHSYIDSKTILTFRAMSMLLIEVSKRKTKLVLNWSSVLLYSRKLTTKRPFQKEISSSNRWFSGDMILFEGYDRQMQKANGLWVIQKASYTQRWRTHVHFDTCRGLNTFYWWWSSTFDRKSF